MKSLLAILLMLVAVTTASVVSEANASLVRSVPSGMAFDVIPPCRLTAGVTSFSDQKTIPQALRDAIKQKLGELVPPNEPFDATDVAWTGHNRRLIFIWTRGSRWIVATEHGGRGYNDPILAYVLSPDGVKATLTAERLASPNSVCSVSEELINQLARGYTGSNPGP